MADQNRMLRELLNRIMDAFETARNDLNVEQKQNRAKLLSAIVLYVAVTFISLGLLHGYVPKNGGWLIIALLALFAWEVPVKAYQACEGVFNRDLWRD